MIRLFILLTIAIPAAAQNYQLPAANVIPWKTGSDLWNNGSLPTYTGVACGGTVADGATDNTTTIQNCINALSSGQAAVLPATGLPPNNCIFISGTIRLSSNKVLRGTVTGGTNSTWICEGASGWLTTQNWGHGNTSNLNPPITSYPQFQSVFNLSGTPLKGDTSVTCSTGCVNVSIGTYIKVFGNDDPTLINQLGNAPPSPPTGTCTYCSDNDGFGDYFRQQIVKVTNVAGSVFTLDQPLYFTPYITAFTSSGGTQSANPHYDIIGFPTQKSGYEYFDLVAKGNTAGEGMIDLQGCLFCWVKGVETEFSGTGNGSFHIKLEYSYGAEIRDNYVHEQRDGSGGSGYGIAVFTTNGNHKIENNIMRHLRHPLIWEGGGGGDAALYNYMDDAYTDDLTYMASARGNHGAHPHMTLFEGNIISHITEDNFHGSSSDHTYFRNSLWGDESNDNGGCNYNPGNSTTPNAATCSTIPSFNAGGMSGFSAIDVFSNNSRMNYVANVLGRTGLHTTWSGATLTTSSGDCCAGTNTVPVVYAVSTSAEGSVSAPSTTILRQGNYDMKTNGVAFYDGGTPHTFDASIYYASKPTFIGSKPWPLIGPDVTGGNLSGTGATVNTNLAYDCYWIGGLHANQAFSPTTCYTVSGSPAVSLSPSSLAFGNQSQLLPSVSKTVTLTNTGTATLSIISISLVTGTNYSITANTCGVTLAATLSCNVSVNFTPLAIGAASDTLRFMTNSASSPDNVSITGTGVIPILPAVMANFTGQAKFQGTYRSQ